MSFAFSDLSGIAAVVALFLTIGGWVYLHGRQTKSTEEIGKRADEAHRKADAVSTDLANYKVEAVEKFVHRITLDQMESRLLSRMDQQDARVEGNFQKLWERIDRAFFHMDSSKKTEG